MAQSFAAKGYIVIGCEKCSLDYVVHAGEVTDSDMKCPQCGNVPDQDSIRRVVENLLENAGIRSRLGEGVDFDDVRIGSLEDIPADDDAADAGNDEDFQDQSPEDSDDNC